MKDNTEEIEDQLRRKKVDLIAMWLEPSNFGCPDTIQDLEEQIVSLRTVVATLLVHIAHQETKNIREMAELLNSLR